METLKPVDVSEYYIKRVSKGLEKYFWTVLFKPIFDILNSKSVINSKDALINAIKSGRIYYQNGAFRTVDRFSNAVATELEKMGASISVEEPCATFTGVDRLHGAHVRSVDLRAGAAIIIAGLAAEGVTEISDIFTIERGYVDIVGKLQALGADIKKIYKDENAFA